MGDSTVDSLEEAASSGPESSATADEPLHPQPATPIAQKGESKASELALRLVSAAFLIPLVLYVTYLGGWAYLALVTAFIVLAQREFYGLIEQKGAEPFVGLGLGFGVAVALVAYWGNEYHMTLLLTGSLLAFMIAQLRKAEITEALASISGTFFGVFYVAWLLSHAIVLRFFYDAAAASYEAFDLAWLGLVPASGAFFMTYAMVVSVACDAGAYFAGRAWGKRPLAPEISPNKSVEGAIGGLLFALVCAVLCKGVYEFFAPDLSKAMSWGMTLGFGLTLAIVGIVGDLVESLIKRDADVKDAGALLPGMGGVLDRIDSPLLAIPAMFYMMMAWVDFRIG
ncbi:MAG: phosphatidate cytidylyltransferase [bacterium]|nr:phosphatidate cytidylyltransferase [bacterium]MCP5042852.1 phosphatidate cytidylyltransferase [bacterium]